MYIDIDPEQISEPEGLYPKSCTAVIPTIITRVNIFMKTFSAHPPNLIITNIQYHIKL